jgi:hypothetical protein
VGALAKIFETVSVGLAAGGGLRLINCELDKTGRIEGLSELGARVGAGAGGRVIGDGVGGWKDCGAQFRSPKPGQSFGSGGHWEAPNPMLTCIESGESAVPLTILHTSITSRPSSRGMLLIDVLLSRLTIRSVPLLSSLTTVNIFFFSPVSLLKPVARLYWM